MYALWLAAARERRPAPKGPRRSALGVTAVAPPTMISLSVRFSGRLFFSMLRASDAIASLNARRSMQMNDDSSSSRTVADRGASLSSAISPNSAPAPWAVAYEPHRLPAEDHRRRSAEAATHRAPLRPHRAASESTWWGPLLRQPEGSPSGYSMVVGTHGCSRRDGAARAWEPRYAGHVAYVYAQA